MMHWFHKIICCLSAGCLLLAACEDEKKPTNLVPIVEVEEALEITRTTASLSGAVRTVGKSEVTVLQFRYGLSTEMDKTAACDPSLSNPSTTLTGLLPNTTYYYCLEAGNGYSSVQSNLLHFTTQPNRTPVLENLEMLNQGPLSITLQYELTDNGGAPITSTGFYYRMEQGEEKQWNIAQTENSVLRARISGLQAQTAYTVQAYAINSIGETRSETFSFRTGQAALVTLPGTLSETVDDSEKYLYATLSIAGPLNGTDIRFIRDMLGRGINGEDTPGRISQLDLTDAGLCSGGASYDGMRYTTDDLVSYGMFAHCNYLQKLLLPGNTKEIEENAFKDCPSLLSLQIPATTTKVLPSDSCKQLVSIEVATGNNAFSSLDGVLYNKEYTQLCWFPEGKETISSFPGTLKTIGEYAFRNCRIKELILPSEIKEIKKGAFYAAQAETIVLPEQVELISYGLFQKCHNLSSVTLGSRTNYLSDYCFDGCSLQHLYVKTNDLPPMCNANTFSKEMLENCVLHVPTGCLAMYRNSNYWGKFKNIVENDYSD